MIFPLIITCEVEPGPVAILKLNGEEFYRVASGHTPAQARHEATQTLLEALRELMDVSSGYGLARTAKDARQAEVKKA